MAQSARDLVLNRKRKVHILNHIDGVLEAGEMLVVLGPPGSGCTSLLKALSGERNGIYVNENSDLNYNGMNRPASNANGQVYLTKNSEVDTEVKLYTLLRLMYTFLSLLSVRRYSTCRRMFFTDHRFAAEARVPRHLPGGVSPAVFAQHQRDVAMAIYGISHTVNTVVGNDFVRGVSGGE